MISEEDRPQSPAEASAELPRFEAVRKPAPGPYLLILDQGPVAIALRDLDAPPPADARLLAPDELFHVAITAILSVAAEPRGHSELELLARQAERIPAVAFTELYPRGFILAARSRPGPFLLDAEAIACRPLKGQDRRASEPGDPLGLDVPLLPAEDGQAAPGPGALLELDGWLIQAIDARSLHQWIKVAEAP